jgi:hypothetical protein
MPGGYADTPGNGPTQSRLTLFARSLEDFYYYVMWCVPYDTKLSKMPTLYGEVDSRYHLGSWFTIPGECGILQVGVM